MRKKNRMLCAALSITALTALAGAGTAMAANGWTEENGAWYYYENNGDYVQNEWKKSGDFWFYLGDDGVMQKDSLIDDGSSRYYVDANGAMVRNRWVAVSPEDAGAEPEDADYIWYYFGANGKAYQAGSSDFVKKEINGKTYGFDQNGHMLYGFVDGDGNRIDAESEDPFAEAEYYFGEWNDGAMLKNSWLEYTAGSDGTSNVDGVDYADYDSLWFWFDNSGRIVGAEDSETVEKTINGHKYSFDQNHVMLSSWVTASSSSASDAKYFSTSMDGHLKKKSWIYAVPSGEMDGEDFENDQQRWFYSGSNGKVYTDGIRTINGKKYLFDEIGRMQSGFAIVNGDGSYAGSLEAEELEGSDFTDGTVAEALSGNELYFFSADEEGDGSMKTGKSVKIELGDDSYTFGFASSGKAYGVGETELVSGKYYENGLLLTANSDEKYAVVEDKDGGLFVVGTSGTKQSGSNKILKDGNDAYLLMKDNRYYAYVESDEKPVYYNGSFYEYDSEAEGRRGEEIAQDTDGSSLPDSMRLNF